MSRQRDALTSILPGLCDTYPNCGVLVFGSVGRGEERPDSDLDVMVVCEGDGPLQWKPGAPLGEVGLNVDLAVFPEAALTEAAASRWFAFWEFAQAEIVHDPTGIAERTQSVIRRHMAAHPEVVSVWEEFAAAVARKKKCPGFDLPHGGRSGVESYLREMLAGEVDP